MIDQIPTENNLAETQYNVQAVTEYCIQETAKRFDLSEAILKAMLKVEAASIGELRVNQDGSYNIGPMQVNSSWLQKFDNYISLNDLIYNGCTNLQVGAWVLKYQVNKAGNDLWQGVRNYHNIAQDLAISYQKQVYVAMQEIAPETNQENRHIVS